MYKIDIWKMAKKRRQKNNKQTANTDLLDFQSLAGKISYAIIPQGIPGAEYPMAGGTGERSRGGRTYGCPVEAGEQVVVLGGPFQDL